MDLTQRMDFWMKQRRNVYLMWLDVLGRPSLYWRKSQ